MQVCRCAGVQVQVATWWHMRSVRREGLKLRSTTDSVEGGDQTLIMRAEGDYGIVGIGAIAIYITC